MTMPGSPTVRRRRLAAELREIRESKGKSGDAVAAALRWSPSKISRYERAKTGLQPREVERLLDYYEITGPRREPVKSQHGMFTFYLVCSRQRLMPGTLSAHTGRSSRLPRA